MRFEDIAPRMEILIEIPSEKYIARGFVDVIIISPEDKEDYWVYFYSSTRNENIILTKKDFETYWRVKPYNEK